MSIKIKVGKQYYDKIAKIIVNAEGRAKARCIDYDDIANACTQIEKYYMGQGITKKALNGSTFSVDTNAQPFAAAYNGTPESTMFSLIYTHNTWYLTGVQRGKTRDPQRRVIACLSDAAKDLLITHHSHFS